MSQDPKWRGADSEFAGEGKLGVSDDVRPYVHYDEWEMLYTEAVYNQVWGILETNLPTTTLASKRPAPTFTPVLYSIWAQKRT